MKVKSPGGEISRIESGTSRTMAKIHTFGDPETRGDVFKVSFIHRVHAHDSDLFCDLLNIMLIYLFTIADPLTDIPTMALKQ